MRQAFGHFRYPTPPLGTSDSGFRAEVESEQAIARGEVYMEMIDSHQHAGLTGPSAEEAARRLTDFGERAQFQGKVALDRHRLKRIMKRHDPAIYPGEYITCVNDPAKALCEKARRGNSEGLPSHGGCLPLSCRNVALTPENTAAWQRVIARKRPLHPLVQRSQRARPGAARDPVIWVFGAKPGVLVSTQVLAVDLPD